MSMIDYTRLPSTVPAVVRAFATCRTMRDLRPRNGTGRQFSAPSGRTGRKPAELIGTLMRVLDEEQQ